MCQMQKLEIRKKAGKNFKSQILKDLLVLECILIAYPEVLGRQKNE